MTRVLKWFVTPILTYTAQVDESMLHDCLILTRFFCRCCTSFVNTVSDSRIKMVCYANFNIYRSSRRKCDTYLYWNSTGYWLYVLNSFVRTVRDSRIKMLSYADFSIYPSSRRKCGTYLYWNSTGYWLYVLNLLCKYV